MHSWMAPKNKDSCSVMAGMTCIVYTWLNRKRPLQQPSGWVSWDHFHACNTASEVERMDMFRVYEPVSLYIKAKLNDE